MNQGPALPLASGLEWAHPLVRDWFIGCFGTPTEPQQEGWPQILARKTTLISAPTGPGKTLAAFFICFARPLRKAIPSALPACPDSLHLSPLKPLPTTLQKTRNI